MQSNQQFRQGFSGDRAWRAGVGLLPGNREVLTALAGVFLFLPSLCAALFFADTQADLSQLIQKIQAQAQINPTAAADHLGEFYARLLPYFLGLLVAAGIAGVGKGAMIALFTHRHRLTVGEALKQSIYYLPSLIGAAATLAFGYFLTFLTLMLVAAVISAAIGATEPTLAPVAAIIIFIPLMLIAQTRFSLILPVIIVDGIRRPLHVLSASWRLTAGNTLRLLGFYALLFIAYYVITLTLTTVLMGIIAYVTGMGHTFTLLSGLLSATISAAAATLWVGILTASHRQLTGA